MMMSCIVKMSSTQKIVAAWGLGIIGLLLLVGSFLQLPRIDVPEEMNPKYTYEYFDQFPNCRQFCAPLDCLGSSSCFDEAKLTGCSAYGSIGCAPCPTGSDCYTNNQHEFERYRDYIWSLPTPDQDDPQIAAFKMALIASCILMLSSIVVGMNGTT